LLYTVGLDENIYDSDCLTKESAMASRMTRRDFLNGVAISVGTGLLTPTELFALGAPAGIDLSDPSIYYPPILTGMRGSHEGSYEVAHALAWRGEKPAHYETLDEHYDLVVVGTGMSGLAAAWYYRKKMGAGARILLLDNHDDFGGHAKRNEFHHEGRMVLSLGGAQNLENPGNYSDAAASLLADIGVDQDAFDAMDVNTPENFALGGSYMPMSV
jgi:spermidine dehydrogenase